MSETNTNNIIPVYPTPDENGKLVYKCSMVPKGSGQIHQINNLLIIPVIFVPGIMGSNLVDNKGGNIWNGDSYGLPLLPWTLRGAVYRKEKLKPSRTKLKETKDLKGDKGFDEPGRSFYLSILDWLQANLNDFNSYNQNSGERFAMQEGDEQKILSPEKSDIQLKADLFLNSLKTEDVQHSYNFDFPVYACGYNWLDDNKKSAEFLLKRINDVLEIEKQKGQTLNKVIIVTHSMGGLVTRYCSQVSGGKEKILGVVHGVMPATGAAAAYTRMKTGNGEGVINAVLGATGADMSVVMSQAPGSLELLPFKEYGSGTEYKQWLRITDGITDYLPKADPFAEIYTTNEWYGLFEEQLVNPDGLGTDDITQKATFDDLLKYTVKIFQGLISDKYHLNSYVFYGKSDAHKCYGSVTWNIKNTSHFSFPKDGINKVGGVQKQEGAEDYNYYKYYEMSDFDVAGDGTVPFISGVAPKGQEGVKCIRYLETDHQKAYKARESQLFTLWSIVQIVKQVTCQ